MLIRLFSILALSLISGGVYAATVDNCTLPECRQIKVRLDARIHKLQGGITPAFGSIVKKDSTSEKYCSYRHDDGGFCYMTQATAIDYCALQQGHLPSAREIAMNAHNEFDAKGVVDTCSKVDHCYPVKVKNLLDGTIDEFNFSSSGYKQPEGDLGNRLFWTSSVAHPNDTNLGIEFFARTGNLSTIDNLFNVNAVLCAVDR